MPRTPSHTTTRPKEQRQAGMRRVELAFPTSACPSRQERRWSVRTRLGPAREQS